MPCLLANPQVPGRRRPAPRAAIGSRAKVEAMLDRRRSARLGRLASRLLAAAAGRRGMVSRPVGLAVEIPMAVEAE